MGDPPDARQMERLISALNRNSDALEESNRLRRVEADEQAARMNRMAEMAGRYTDG